MRGTAFFLTLLMSVLFSPLALAESFFVTEVSGRGVDEELKTSVRELAISAVSEAGGEISQSAKSADYLLRPKLIRLGRSFVVTVSKWEKRKRIYAAKAKSQSVEELDQVVSRAVRSAMGSSPSGPRVGEITEKEKGELQERRETLNLQFFALGPFGLQNMNTEGAGIHLAWGYIWEVNLRAAVRFTVEGTVDASKDTASVAAGTLGASYYFSQNDVSPYVFADFGYGVATGTDVKKDSAGFSLGGGVGLIFFRTSKTQMDLSFRYLAILEDNEKGTPATAGLRLGILF